MHKLFVICDDPNGVVEGNSSGRRSFSCVPKDERDDKKRKKKNKKQSSKISRDDMGLQRAPSRRQIHKVAKGSLGVEDTHVPIHRVVKSGGSVKENIGEMLTRSRSSDERRCFTVGPGKDFESPNLVAKLMGLEEVPSNPKCEAEKIIRPVFEMSSSRATGKMETEEKTLTKVLEIVKSKGLLTMAYDRTPERDDIETPLVLIKPISRANSTISEIRSRKDDEKAREIRVKKIASHLEVMRRLDKEQFDAKLMKIKLKLEHRKRMICTANFANVSLHEQTSPSDFDESKALVRNQPSLDSKSGADIGVKGEDNLVNSVNRLLDGDRSSSEESRDWKDMEAKLVVDFASEYLERKKLRECETVPGSGGLSGEKMAEEIGRGVETLRRFSLAGDKNEIDEAVRSEMKYACYISGMWEIGWRRGFSSEDHTKAVADIGNLVFFDLVRELFL